LTILTSHAKILTKQVLEDSMMADEATEPTNRSERLKTAFLSLSDESQTFMLGQAEGLRVAQTLSPGPQEQWSERAGAGGRSAGR
jgi:hypothetical protein